MRKSNQQNAGMGARSQSTYVRKMKILGDEEPTFASCSLENPLVWVSDQLLALDGMYIVVFINEELRQFGRQVLVQLDLHDAILGISGTGRSSWAQAAA